MAFQVKVEYGGKRFATFLLENVSYDGLVSSIRKNCSSLAHLDADKIRLRYRDEDGDMVNVCQADLFAFSEMLRTAKEVKDRDYKKIFIQANEIDSPCPRKMKRVDFGVENPSTGDELSCLEPKQLSFHASTFPSASFFFFFFFFCLFYFNFNFSDKLQIDSYKHTYKLRIYNTIRELA